MERDNFPNILQQTARGSLILLIGQIISGAISTVTVMWMARVLGPTSYGEYTLAILPVTVAMIFQDLGMNQSLTRFSALYRYEKRKELKTVVYTGLLFELFSAMVISIIIYALAGTIASSLLQRPELEQLVKITALAVLGNGGLQTTIGAIFVGYEIMTPRSLLQIIFSSSRLILTVSLILVGWGVFGAILSYSVATVASGFIGIILFLKLIKFENNNIKVFDLDTLKSLLKYGLPLSIGNILGGVLTQIYNYLLAIFVVTDLIGNYGATINFGIIIAFIITPISSALLPFFSKFNTNDPKLKTIFYLSIKYTSLVITPAVLIIIALSSPISTILYGTQYPYVPLYLSFYLIVFLFEGLGGITLTNLISGIGETRISLIVNIINLVIGGILATLLVPRYQVTGLLLTMIIAPRFGWFYQILWVKKNLKITIPWITTAKIYIVGLTAFIPTYLLANYSYMSNWEKILVGGILFCTIFLLSLLRSGIIKKVDLDNLSISFSKMGPSSRLFRVLFSIMNRLIKD